jgi:hypothetical protein
MTILAGATRADVAPPPPPIRARRRDHRAHRRLTITFSGLLTIIAPRHPQRGPPLPTSPPRRSAVGLRSRA